MKKECSARAKRARAYKHACLRTRARARPSSSRRPAPYRPTWRSASASASSAARVLPARRETPSWPVHRRICKKTRKGSGERGERGKIGGSQRCLVSDLTRRGGPACTPLLTHHSLLLAHSLDRVPETTMDRCKLTGMSVSQECQRNWKIDDNTLTDNNRRVEFPWT